MLMKLIASQANSHNQPAEIGQIDYWTESQPVPTYRSTAETDTHSLPTPFPGIAANTDGGDLSLSAGSCPSDPNDHTATDAPKNVPGYTVERTLGHGGMGTVYLAKQLSLDRLVALKVMSKLWAQDPVFVARFVREAYAAALLNHPNVVQIYDIGEVDETRFISMEYVDGKSLSDLLKAGGRLDPETAVGYILQAARGLKHAHDRGIIHRDIKPDNLLLDQNGIVKVADLGLVKTPELSRYDDRLADDSASSQNGLLSLPADMTGVRMALGTPAYMAPEQCRDAATVDHRADIYSLGCTLYTLVTGRQPFQGTDSLSVMKMHAYEIPVPPETHTPRLPRELSAIILRMMAKLPGDRYRHLGEVIRTLEEWLGTGEEKKRRYTPREDQIAEVELLARAFRTAPTAPLRERAVSGFLTGCVLLAVLLTMFGKTAWAFGVAGMIVQSVGIYFLLNGWSRETYLFKRARRTMMELTRGDLLVIACGIGIFLAFLWVSHLLWISAGFGLIGTAVALALWYGFDRKVDSERFPTIEAADQFVRKLRRQGVMVDDARYVVAKHSGRYWEEFFEAVFGYEAKIAMRAELLRGGSAGRRERFASWREPIVHLINQVETLRKKSRDRALIERAEYERLCSTGLQKREARERASVLANELIEHGDIVRELVSDGTATMSQVRLPNFNSSSMEFELQQVVAHRKWSRVLDVLIGPPVRMVLAAVLLAACSWWVWQNGLLQLGGMVHGVQSAPLSIDGIAAHWTSWCDTANPGWGGILLLGSLFYRGERMAALALLGATVTVLGHKFGIRTVHPIQDYHVAMMVGTLLALLGYRLGRR